MVRKWLSRSLSVLLIVLAISWSVSSCTTPGGDTPPPDSDTEHTPSPDPSTGPDVRVDDGTTGLEPDDPNPSPAVQASPDGQGLTENPVPSPEPTERPVPISVSREVFSRTFSAVEAFIAEMNTTIRNKDYVTWLTYLGAEYRDHLSSPDILRQLSESPTLQRLGVNLRSLEDYFIYVVVPSRANMKLDDLVFLSEDAVEAIMIVGNRRITVYRLIKIADQWKIGL